MRDFFCRTMGDDVIATTSFLCPTGMAVDRTGKLLIIDASQRLGRLGATDVLPGIYPNVIVPGTGRLDVAILSSRGFDARTLDAATLRVGRAELVARSLGVRDVNGDGLLDIVFKVGVDDMKLRPDDREVAVTGKTRDGTPFVDADFITLGVTD